MTHRFQINYLHHGEPSNTVVEDADEHLFRPQALLLLMARHGVPMPEQNDEHGLLAEAEKAGISDVRVSRLPGRQSPGGAPGHYRQP